VQLCLQCFDTVGWVSGWAPGLYKLRDEALVWLSVWNEVQIVFIWSSWFPSSLASFKSRLVLPFWYWLSPFVLEKRLWKCVIVVVVVLWCSCDDGYNHITHTSLTALFPGLLRWTDTRKVKPIWILLKQETLSGSGISWAICKSTPRSRQIATPAPHHSVFYGQDALPAAQPTVSKCWRQY